MPMIRDPVHGNISLTDGDLALIDTKKMQRLRFIKQLSFTYLVYPGAMHSRFEHSLGVMHVADRMGELLSVKDRPLLRAAALLHDVGHNPFSHILESEVFGDHEDNLKRQLKDGELKEALSGNGISPAEVLKVLSGKGGILSSIISSDIDADRFDYLSRDAYYCGVAYGVMDSKILTELLDFKGKLAVTEKGVIPAESILFARYQMHGVVYNHHTGRIAGLMMKRAVEEAMKNRELSADGLLEMTDDSLMSLLLSQARYSSGPYSSVLARRIMDRRLHKRALVKRWPDLSEDERLSLIKLKPKARKIEAEIAEDLGVGPENVLIDIPEIPVLKEAGVDIVMDGKSVKLSEFSPLAKAMTQVYKTFWKFSVYAPKELAAKVGKKAEGYF